MPWVAIHYDDVRAWKLKTQLNCVSIPFFVILTKWGAVVTDNAYTLVCQIGVGLFEYLDYKQFGGKAKVE